MDPSPKFRSQVDDRPPLPNPRIDNPSLGETEPLAETDLASSGEDTDEESDSNVDLEDADVRPLLTSIVPVLEWVR